LLQANENYAPKAPEGKMGVAAYPNWVVAYAGVQSSPTKERREDGQLASEEVLGYEG